VRAIATFVAAQMPATGPVQQIVQDAKMQSQRGAAIAAASADSQATRAVATGSDEGAVIYAAACADCHEGPRAMPYGGIGLALSSGINGPNATNLADVVLYGLPATAAARSPIMPAFANSIDDRQLAALARYLRARFSGNGPWNDIDKSVHDARSSQRAATVGPAPAEEAVPPIPTQRTPDEAQH